MQIKDICEIMGKTREEIEAALNKMRDAIIDIESSMERKLDKILDEIAN